MGLAASVPNVCAVSQLGTSCLEASKGLSSETSYLVHLVQITFNTDSRRTGLTLYCYDAEKYC